jgi:PIN domain nuclease of toxin-antitoxin system
MSELVKQVPSPQGNPTLSSRYWLSLVLWRLIEDSVNQPFLSAASLWEMAIKLSLDRLHLGRPFEGLVPEQMAVVSADPAFDAYPNERLW